MLMRRDNIVSDTALTFADFGITPRTVEAELPGLSRARLGDFGHHNVFSEAAASAGNRRSCTEHGYEHLLG